MRSRAASCQNGLIRPLPSFAINTFKPNSTYVARQFEYDVDITLDGNTSGTPDFTAFTADFGFVATGPRNGQLVVVLLNNLHPEDPNYPRVDFNATAPTESSMVLMPVLASTVGLTTTRPNGQTRPRPASWSCPGRTRTRPHRQAITFKIRGDGRDDDGDRDDDEDDRDDRGSLIGAAVGRSTVGRSFFVRVF